MPRLRRSLLLLTCSAVLASLLAVPAGADEPTFSRVYLMAAEDSQYYWSVDPADPEISVGTISLRCGGTVWGTPDAKPCLQGTDISKHETTHSLFFAPASLIDAPSTWNAAEPVTFHLAMHLTSPGPFAVSFGFQLGTKQVESAPATETSPNVWEGALTSPGQLDSSVVVLPFVRIRGASPTVTIDLQTAGSSWFDLPAAVPARAVPDLLAQNTYHPEHNTFSTPQRSFTFNDAQWAVTSFTGDLTQARTFDFDLDRDAEFLYAWAEDYETPLVYDVVKGKQVEPRKVTEGLTVSMSRDGELLDRTGGASGRGETSSAASDVAAGPISLTISPVGAQASAPYTAYVLEVFGPRTLASFREKFTSDNFRAVSVASCQSPLEPVPVTEDATTFSVDLDWDTVAPGLPKWTLSYDLPGVGSFPCGEGGSSDRVRFTIPTDRVWWVGATTSEDSLTVSEHDTVFELKVHYSYSPPPLV